MGYLDRTKVPVSIDIGFGDVIYPVIAEKFEVFVSLGLANGRYKDFYDIYVLADRYDFI